MALIKCKECSKEVSNKAGACPHCGAPLKPKHYGCGSFVGLVFLAFLLVILVGSMLEPSTTPSRRVSSTALTPAKAPRQPIWNKRTATDDLTGKSYSLSSIESENSFEFNFPYAEPQRATLTIREKHPRWGTDVFVSIERGQFLCSLNDCRVVVKFDDEKPHNVDAVEPDDHSSTMLFLEGESNFIAKLRNAKRVAIGATFYKEGTRTLVFDAAGYAANK